MNLKKHGGKVSDKLSQVMKGGHKRRIIITDKHNNAIVHLPVLLLVVVTLIVPILAGFILIIFLQSDYHAIYHNPEDNPKV